MTSTIIILALVLLGYKGKVRKNAGIYACIDKHAVVIRSWSLFFAQVLVLIRCHSRRQPWTAMHRFYCATITFNTSISLPYLKCFHLLYVWICLIIINSLLCHEIIGLRPCKSIKIISDCKYSTNEIPNYSTAVIPTTHKTTRDQSSPNSKPSISRNSRQISRMKTSNQELKLRLFIRWLQVW